MTTLIRRDPFGDLRTTMDRLFDEGFARPRRVFAPQTYESPFPVEVSETEDALDVKASLPGVKPEEVDISVSNDVLTIKAEHRETTETSEDKKRDFYRREIRYGAFHRSMNLPVSVDADKAEASFDNGVLSLHLPKAAANRPHQIKVTGASNGATPIEGATSEPTA